MATKMVDMEKTDEEKLDTIKPISIDEVPDYPWGLRICLCEEELDKLDVDCDEIVVGGVVSGRFIGKVTSSSKNEDEGSDGKIRRRVEIQITALGVDCDDE